MAGFEIPLVLLVFGYFEPGTASAAALGTRQPFGFHRGACPSFGPSRSHGFGPGCTRASIEGFRLFSVHIPLKTMDIWRRKITPYVSGVGAQLAGAVPVVHVTYSGAEGQVL